jgi:hypothetical protein
MEEYKGIYGITVVQEGKDGKIYKKYAYESTRKDGKFVPADKSRPIAVRLGDKATAISALKSMLVELEGGPVSIPDDESLPF